jgi:hypothetical protein
MIPERFRVAWDRPRLASRIVPIDREVAPAVPGRVRGSKGADATAPCAERPAASPDMRRAAAEARERIDVWVNEGGAGGEVNR